jgi:hypothetical protein
MLVYSNTMSTGILIQQPGACLNNVNDKTGTGLLRNVSPDSFLSGLLGPGVGTYIHSTCAMAHLCIEGVTHA